MVTGSPLYFLRTSSMLLMLHPSLSVVTLRCAQRLVENMRAVIAVNNGFIFMLFVFTKMFSLQADELTVSAMVADCRLLIALSLSL